MILTLIAGRSFLFNTASESMGNEGMDGPDERSRIRYEVLVVLKLN